ncbi:hypothetical protein VTN02DRAFT_4947 [Thermoascus thermophilus]
MSGFFRQDAAKSKQGPQSADDHGDQDLNTILDRSQRGDLTVLIVQITEAMRKVVTDNFEVPTPPESETADQPTPQEEDNSESTESEALEVGEEKAAKDSGKKALSSSELAVKADALKYLDDWRDSVLLRVGEVVNKDDEAAERERHAKASRPRPQSQEMSVTKGEGVSTRLPEIYPPIETPLAQLPRPTKLLILHALLLLLLSLQHYSAHSRILLLNVASSLGLYLKDLNHIETRVARGLLDVAKQMSADEEAKKKAQQNSNARKWKVGIASVAGAALVGITGGLAAPLVAAGIGTVMGGLGLGATAAAGYLGALAGSSVVVGGLFGAYGGRMTGRMMDKYAREVEDFAFIPTRAPRRRFRSDREAAQQDRRLRVTIGITGWVTEEEDFVVPWRVIGPDSEVFALRWELESLMNLGNAISSLVTSAAWSIASREIISRTFFAHLMSAVMLPLGLVKIARVVDNPFSVAKSRADKAGEVLADALINKAQGERPVTLIGYSLGSRVIFSCLQSLAKRRAYGLVESAILMGSPIPSSTRHWRMMRTVVSGRLVNVFSENDSVLAFLYRTSSVQLGVAGLQRVEGLPGVENVDASDIISGHLRYQYLIGKILTIIAFEEIDAEEVRKEELALQARDREEEQQRIENLRQDEAGTGGKRQSLGTGDDPSDEARRLQRQVERRTQERLMYRKMERMEIHCPDVESEDEMAPRGIQLRDLEEEEPPAPPLPPRRGASGQGRDYHAGRDV